MLAWRGRKLSVCVATTFATLLCVAPALAREESSSAEGQIVHACARAAPGDAQCFALVLEQTASSQGTSPRGSAQPFTARSGSALVGPAGGLTPEDLASAYGYSPTTGGLGQTVGIIDAYDDPSLAADLAIFDTEYGLPACTGADGCLKQVGQTGGQPPASDAKAWSVEEALDAETVHAVCPNCKILLVESTTNKLSDLAAAANEAVTLGATVVSNSYGAPETSYGLSEREAYNHPGVPIVASTGDQGYYSWDYVNQGFRGNEMPSVPAALPSVVAVGGTKLSLNSDGTRADETVWDSSGPDDEKLDGGASGGGCSLLFEAQPWQRDVSGFPATGCGRKRLDADVAAVADPETGLDIYDSYDCGEACAGVDVGWERIGGTSLSAPLIGALYALAGGGHGVPYPGVSLYGESADASSRFDVTAGGNGFCGGEPVATCGNANSLGIGLVDCDGTTACNAVSGFDGPSGVGTPEGLGLFEPQPPTATLSVPAALSAGSPGSFNAGGTDPYPGGSLASASWQWGDGSGGSGLTATHSYAAPGTYTVTLTVTDAYGVKSAPVTATVDVDAAAAPPGAGIAVSTGGSSTISSASGGAGSSSNVSAEQGIAAFQIASSGHSPSARLASSSLSASAAGTLALKVQCAASGAGCSGTVVLRTLAGFAAGKRRARLTLGSASFSCAPGKTAVVTLHLTARGRALLARARSLRAVATFALHASSGAVKPTTAVVTVRSAIAARVSH